MINGWQWPPFVAKIHSPARKLPPIIGITRDLVPNVEPNAKRRPSFDYDEPPLATRDSIPMMVDRSLISLLVPTQIPNLIPGWNGNRKVIPSELWSSSSFQWGMKSSSRRNVRLLTSHKHITFLAIRVAKPSSNNEDTPQHRILLWIRFYGWMMMARERRGEGYDLYAKWKAVIFALVYGPVNTG